MLQYTFRLFVVLFVLAAFSSGAGGKANLCITPDGKTHITQANSSCALLKECSPCSEFVPINSSVRGQSPCLDIELGGDFRDPTNRRNIVQVPPPTAAPFGLSTVPVPSSNKPFRVISLNTLPHLALQHSVVLLI
jgi:hypothetical protein